MKALLKSFILITFLHTASAYAQPPQAINRNTLYADFAVKGATYSANYDRIFSYGKKLAKSYRVGLSFLNNAIALPLGVQFFSGQGSHHVEYSLTVVPYIEKYKELFTGNNLSDKKIFIMPGAGYRYQPPKGSFFAKVVLGPIIYLDPASDNFWRMDAKVYAGITAGAGISF